MRDANTLAALTASLSHDRLTKYIAACSGDVDAALTLYERNMRLSEAFYTPLQAFEVCMRNRLDTELTRAYGLEWLTDPAAAPLSGQSRALIADAREQAGSNPPRGSVIAELKFAFWVGLLNARYDSTLWRRAAYRAFSCGQRRARKPVHSRVNAIRRFRNRIAHHEPIFDRNPRLMHDEILEATGWMCGITAAWARDMSRVPDFLD